MEKAITTALLMIASIIAAMALVNAVIPAANRTSGALLTANAAAADRIKTDIEIVHASGNATTDKVTVWVKNIGTQRIIPINASDVILETPNSGDVRIPYVSGCSSGDCWDYDVEGSGSDWENTVTVKFTLTLLTTTVVAGVYSVTVSVFNAISATEDFSV